MTNIARESLAMSLRDEAQEWLHTPNGYTPGTFAYYVVPLLQSLAARIEDAP